MLNLSKCHYFGPRSPEKPDRVSFPPKATDNPFLFLPEAITLSSEELDLAVRYENGDFSGGYLRSQTAYFRRPKSPNHHNERHIRLRRLQTQVAALVLKLPDSFIQLVTNDEYINRIRHNTIWPTIPDKLTPFPTSPAYHLANVFYESQGCGYWHLLLAPDHSHVVVYTDSPIGTSQDELVDRRPDLTKDTFCECAPSFDEWLAYYFLDCRAGDAHYAELLENYPNM